MFWAHDVHTVHRHMEEHAPSLDRAAVLVEIGWLHDAELEISEILDRDPDNRRALGLFAKLKHMRGELSQAIGCWAHLYVASGTDRAAHTRLAALLHLADDPERGAAELWLGQHPHGNAPAGQLALEEAFRLFRAGKLDDARARCVAVAARYRAGNADTYRLAVLAIAWIAELSGDLQDAAAFLERLGRERGFELDRDRLIALQRVYTLLATPATLEAALKICQHLLSSSAVDDSDHLTLLAQLTVLYQSLGKRAQAEEQARRYFGAFRRYMYRPSFAEAVDVAARMYVPLPRLARVRFCDHELPQEVSERARHVAAALQGELDSALVCFAASDHDLDRKYCAEVAAMAGNDEQAEQLYLALLEHKPDLEVFGWLLDRWLTTRSNAVAARLADPSLVDYARTIIELELRRAPLRPSLWRHLGALHELTGAHTESTRCFARAASLRQRSDERDLPIGRVLSASVYQFIGTAKGLIHEIWAHRETCHRGTGGGLADADIFGNITPDMKRGVRNTFLAVREYTRSKFPERSGDLMNYTYTFKLPKEDEPSGGLSAGLPIAMAFLSVFLQRPIAQNTAFTGILVADAHDVLTVHPVGDITHKLFAAYHRNLDRLIVPRGNQREIAADVRIVPQIARDLLRYAATLDEAVQLTWGHDVFVQLSQDARAP